MSKILTTDYYQLSMVIAYIILDKAETQTGFECFFRAPKAEVTNNNYYNFAGEQEVHKYIDKVKEELRNKTFITSFINVVADKLDPNRKEEYIRKIKNFFNTCNTDFEYSVCQENTRVFAKVPCFQFKGPLWIGTLLETPITNIVNGRTGLNTQKNNGTATQFMIDIVNGNRKTENWDRYLQMLKFRAEEYVLATKVPLMDASFRRAAGYKIAIKTAEIALKNGFRATSNVGGYFDSNLIKKNMIGGTMAHSFIMSFESELEAFKAWFSIFPGSTILVDTYDTINAIKMIIENNLKPDFVRIDSGDFFTICQEVRDILDDAGWYDVGIYISGDLTPEILTKLEEEKVPFNKAMIGTKLTNIGEIVNINCGFVYKIVEFTKANGDRIFPEKKATGKGNYPGLKQIIVENNEIKLDTRTGNIGFINMNKTTEDMNVVYIRA